MTEAQRQQHREMLGDWGLQLSDIGGVVGCLETELSGTKRFLHYTAIYGCGWLCMVIYLQYMVIWLCLTSFIAIYGYVWTIFGRMKIIMALYGAYVVIH